MSIPNTELCLPVNHLIQHQIMLFDWIRHLIDMIVRSETINDTQPLAMIYATKSDSSIQAMYQEYPRSEGQDYLSNPGLRSQMGGIYS